MRDEGSEHLTRRELMRVGGTGAIALSAASLLDACGGTSATSATSSKAAVGKPRRGGTLTVAQTNFGATETLNPANGNTFTDYSRYTKSLFEPLFLLTGAQKVIPWLAEQATSNANATRWTLELRQGVSFHNGKTMTADDVVYTMRSWASAGSYMSPFATQIIDLAGVKKIDKYTVDVPMKLAMADFPSVLTWVNASVVPADFKDFKHPIGTGPFKFESFTPGTESVFTAYPGYWVTGLPYLDRLVINSTFTDDAAKVNALLAGSVDYVPLMDPTLAKENATNSSIRVRSANGAGWLNMYMRMDHTFADPRVRLAMKLIADRPALIEGALAGYGVVQNDTFGYGLPYYYSDLTQPHDPEKAKALLKAAGVPDLTVTLTTSPLNIGEVQSAELYAQQAKAAGVTVNIKNLPASEYFLTSAGYPFQFAQDAWNPVPSVPLEFLLTYNGQHSPWSETHWAYNDPKQAALILDAVGTVDPAAANEKWRALQEQQMTQGGNLIWSTWPYIDGSANNVQGVGPSPAGSALAWDWKHAWLSA